MKNMRFILIFLLSLSVVACKKDEEGPKIPTQGLIAFYPFNGNANDASGNGLNGTMMTGAVLTADRFGNPDKACDVNSGYVEVADNDDLDVESFTISIWFKLENVYHAFNCLVGKDYSTAFAIGISSGGSGECPAPVGTLRPIRLYVGAEMNHFTDSDIVCGSDSWVHGVTTFDNLTGAIQLYINGTLVQSGTLTAGSIGNNTYPLGIGRDGRWSDKFTGSVDDVRIYNRVLSANEIALLYGE
jgi:hypothetical protein